MSEKLKTKTIELPSSLFCKDFLQIEVAKKLAIYGDDLLLRVREEKREFIKQYELNFTHNVLYYCERELGSAVKLIAIYM